MKSPDAGATLTPATLLQLQEEERYRLAQALMRGPGQILANALSEIEYSLPLLDANPELAASGLAALRDELHDGLSQLQAYVAELQPPLLDEMGLGQAVKLYLARFSERTGIRASCYGCNKLRERYPATIEIAVFRILQEALENVQRHSGATAVQVRIARSRAHLRVTVQDNGNGFAVKTKQQPGRRQLGLIAMRDRAEMVGGQLHLFSVPRRGVRVVVKIPYHGTVNLILSQTGGQHESQRTADEHWTQPKSGERLARQGYENDSQRGASRRGERSRAGKPQQAERRR